MEILTFSNFSKRINSTKIPIDADGVSKSVVLKDGTSIYNPVFTLNSNDSIVYVKAFGLYYYVSDIVHVRQNVLEVHCRIDVMSSYRSQILNSTAYVIYSSSNYNTNIIDTRLSSNNESIVNYSTLSLFTVVTNYIVNYVGTDGSSIVFSNEDEFNDLITAINNTDFLDSILVNPTDYFSKLYNSVTDCIKSAFSVPVSIAKGSVKQPVLGKDYVVTKAVGNAVPDLTNWSGTISIPWNFSDFRNRSQFTSLILYLPGYGMIELNSDDYNGKTSISISASLSNLSGDLVYYVGNTAVCKCNIATPIQIGNISSNGLGAISSGVAAGLSYATGNEFGAIMSGFNAVTSLMSRSVGSVGINGGFSSFAIEPKIVLYAISHDTNVEPSNLSSTAGRPLNEQVYISSLKGYCQTVNANVSAPTSEENINRINAIMNGGFFIE